MSGVQRFTAATYDGSKCAVVRRLRAAAAVVCLLADLHTNWGDQRGLTSVAVTYTCAAAQCVWADCVYWLCLLRYFAWYGVQGIFLDEGSNNCALVPYYDSLVAYIRAWSPKAVSVLNWGTGRPAGALLLWVLPNQKVLP